MVKSIFKKKKSNIKKYFSLILLLFLLFIFFYLLILNNKKEFIIIPANQDNFSVIPKDRGGEKVANLNKKSLNLKSEQKIEKNYNKPIDLLFSIQIYASNELENVSRYLDKITNSNESIYLLKDFYVLSLNSEIGVEYFLLYKNFETRQAAKKYCLNYLVKIDKCLITDTTKF